MDDRVHAVARLPRSEAASVTSPVDELGAPRGEPGGAVPIAHERAHRDVAHAQRVHDVRPDEAGPARHEHGHSAGSKFL